jgi:hypothetical protein
VIPIVSAPAAAPVDLVDDRAAPAGGATGLLPAPGPGAIAYGTALCSVYELLSQARTVGLELGQQGVAENRRLQARAFADELAAIAREQDNQRGSGLGFFDTIAKVAGDVARDILHGRVDSALADGANDVASAWNSPHFWSDLEKGLDQVSAVVEAIGEVAHQLGGPAGTAVAAVAASVDAGVQIGADLAGARGEAFAADAAEAHADATSSKNDVDQVERQVTALLDDTKSSDQSLGRALASIASATLISDTALVSSTAPTG